MHITHNEDGFRIETVVDGHAALIEYTLQDAIMTIRHTWVPPQIGGRGIAAALTQYALELAKDRGYTIVPACPYARVYIQRHPEYQALLH
jgi:predicted GNAT family acetyltransferase